MYATAGRQSVPPEQLLKATVLMALYSIRSERQFCERLRYDLLFKYFLDLNMDAEGFDHSTFSKNRERLLSQEIADRFFAAVVKQARLRRYISGEHFSVDGTHRPQQFTWPQGRISTPCSGRVPLTVPAVEGSAPGCGRPRGGARTRGAGAKKTPPSAVTAAAGSHSRGSSGASP